MARHVLTVQERIRGIRRALKSRKLPKQFRAPLQRTLRRLEGDASRKSFKVL